MIKYFITLLALVCFINFNYGQIVNDNLNFFNYKYDRELIKKNHVETITEQMNVNNKNSSSKIIYHFDKNGLLIKQSIQDSNGIKKRDFYFVTNSHNDLVLRIEIDYQYKKTDTVKYYKFYEANKIIKDPSSEIPISYSYYYNQRGYLIQTSINSNFGIGNNTRRIRKNQLDRLGRPINIIEKVYQNDTDILGRESSNRDIIYTEDGKVSKEIEKVNGTYSWINNNGSFEYEYDNKGNLSKMKKINSSISQYSYNKIRLITSKKSETRTEKDDFMETDSSLIMTYRYSYTFFKK